MSVWPMPRTQMGVDSAGFLTTLRRLRTGQGREHLICGPSFSFLHADPLPQPSACVRTCRDLLRLCLRRPAGGCGRGGCRGEGDSACSDPRGSEADHRRASRGDRRQSGRRALSMGRHLPRRRLRLLGARLLGVRPAGHSASAQLVRALRPRPAHSAIKNEGRRLALLFRARTRRHLHRPGPHGACAALRHPCPSGEVGILRVATRRRPARLARVIASLA